MPYHVVLQQTHTTLGFLILALVVTRLAWRARGVVPRLAALPAWQRAAARATHYGLYAVLLLFPLSGWASLSVYRGANIWFFGTTWIPPILPELPLQHRFGYAFFAEIHRACWKVGAALLALHVLAALWHHLVRRDGVLLRMWPGTGGGGPQPG
jgi:cytochrome b561